MATKYYNNNSWASSFNRQNPYATKQDLQTDMLWGTNYTEKSPYQLTSPRMDIDTLGEKIGTFASDFSKDSPVDKMAEGGTSSSNGKWGMGNNSWGQYAGAGLSALEQIKTGDRRGLYDTLDPVYHLAGGRESAVGNGVSDAGIGVFKAGVQSGNPIVMLAGAGLKVSGGLINAAFGLKTDKELLASANDSISKNSNFISNAGYFDDVKGPASKTATNVYKGGWFSGGKARRKNEALTASMDDAYSWATRSTDNNVNNIKNNQIGNFMANYSAFGGPLFTTPENNSGALNYGFMTNYLTAKNNQALAKNTNVNLLSGVPNNTFALGGDVQMNGADFTTGLTRIDAGLSHEENPNGGVQYGVDGEGTSNLLEEGETIFDKYVFSDRILIDDITKERFHIGKKKDYTFADLSKKLEKEASERPNDPISQSSLKTMLTALQEHQERQKQLEQASQAEEAFSQLTPQEQVNLMQQVQDAQQAQGEEAMPQKDYSTEEYPQEGYAGQYPQEGIMQEQGTPQEGQQFGFGGNLIGGNYYYNGGALGWLNKNHPELSSTARAAIAKFLEFKATEYTKKYSENGRSGNSLYAYLYNDNRPIFNRSDTNVQRYYAKSGLSPKDFMEYTFGARPKDKSLAAKYDATLATLQSTPRVASARAYIPSVKASDVTVNTAYAQSPFKPQKTTKTVNGKRKTVYKANDGKVYKTNAEALKANQTYQAKQTAQQAQNTLIRQNNNVLNGTPQPRVKIARPTTQQSVVKTSQVTPQATALVETVTPQQTVETPQQTEAVVNQAITDVQQGTATPQQQAIVSNLTEDDITRGGKALQQKLYSLTEALTDSQYAKWLDQAGYGDIVNQTKEDGTPDYLDFGTRYQSIINDPNADISEINALAENGHPELRHAIQQGYNFGRVPLRTKYNVEDFKNRLAKYTESKKMGNTEGNYKIDQEFALNGYKDFAELEKSPEYVEYTNDALATINRLKGKRWKVDENNPNQLVFEDGSTMSADDFNNISILDMLRGTADNTSTYKKGDPVPFLRKGDDGYVSLEKGAGALFEKLRTDGKGGTFHLNPYKSTVKNNSINYLINDDGTIEEITGDTKGLDKVDTYNWRDTGADNTATYYKIKTPKEQKEKNPVEALKTKPKLVPDWMRYAGILGPAVGLGMQAMGIGKPNYGELDGVMTYTRNGGAQATMRPIGNRLVYRPMDVWNEQNRMDANSRATDRAIANSTANAGSRMAGFLANGYNSQMASGDLFAKALEYNDNKRERVATFNKDTDKFNAQAFNQLSQFNADSRNKAAQYNASLAAQIAQAKLNADAQWYNGLYGNVSGLFKGISDLGRENFNHNQLARMTASGLFRTASSNNPVFTDYVEKDET